MRFTEKIEEYDWDNITERISVKSALDVENALRKDNIDFEDFLSLISPAALPYLEKMAQKSRMLTQQRFGKTIQMYIPLYLTNARTNHCV